MTNKRWNKQVPGFGYKKGSKAGTEGYSKRKTNKKK